MSLRVPPSRTVLVSFFNDTLKLQIAKIDDLGNGAEYCQLIDSIYGDIPMNRVKFGTRNSIEMESNYTILHQAFSRHKIDQIIDSSKLMKCRLQDNLQFSQWLYFFWLDSQRLADYDPVARRAESVLKRVRQVPSVALNNGAVVNTKRSFVQSPRIQETRDVRAMPVQAPTLTPARHARQVSATNKPEQVSLMINRLADYENEMEGLNLTVDTLQRERDLYYDKLLSLEQLVNRGLNDLYEFEGNSVAVDNPNQPMLCLLRKCQDILYSTVQGFHPVAGPDDEPF